jgi:hypothetical protein
LLSTIGISDPASKTGNMNGRRSRIGKRAGLKDRESLLTVTVLLYQKQLVEQLKTGKSGGLQAGIGV